ncbi:MAG: molecular chaperone HtpG [Planctomycetota bacterium]
MTQHVFQTEVQQLLHLMIHSLYSQREIFLRELISNSSDACDKLRFAALTEPKLTAGDSDLRIDVAADKEAKTITITDNGIGLTEAEAVEHLGTIAKSGTKAFLQALGDGQKKDAQLIGQFGVGFYSAFMVCDRVVVESRSARATADDGVRWESTGDGTFATEKLTRAIRGTTVTLHLKDDATEFIDSWKLRQLIKTWSDYVPYPVRMLAEKDGKPTSDFEQVNSGQPLWTKAKDAISDEDHTKFYRSACRLWDEPATRLHATVEGTLSFTALLYVPSERPYDLFQQDRKGVSLYVRRVFIMDDCKDLLPEWLRFVRGVIDSDDLPLNVSRELLQGGDTVKKIRKQVVKRLIDHLQKLASSGDENDRAAWSKVDASFGAVIREGVITDHENQERIAKLVRWRSTWTSAAPAEGEAARSATTGLEDYIRRAGDAQKSIYYVLAPNLAAARANPAIEGFIKRGREVLFLAEPVDEFVVQHLTEFDGRKLVDIAKGAADLADGNEKTQLEAKTKELDAFLVFAKDTLAADVSSVRLTARLADSPCCLVGDDHAVSAQLEEMMRRMGQAPPPSKQVLELNPAHPLVARLAELHGDESRRGEVADWLHSLRDQALLASGAKVPDGAAAAKRMQVLLQRAAGAA